MLPDAAIGVVCAAMISALMVFLSTVFSKEQKTSEFRQAWINEFRQEMSEFIGSVSENVAYAEQLSEDTHEAKMKFISDNLAVFQRAEHLKVVLELRLNPDENKVLVGYVQTYLEDMIDDYAAKPLGSDRGDALTTRIVDETQRMLRHEWKRVKRGEPIFRWTKWISFVALVATLGLSIWWLSGKYNFLDFLPFPNFPMWLAIVISFLVGFMAQIMFVRLRQVATVVSQFFRAVRVVASMK